MDVFGSLVSRLESVTLKLESMMTVKSTSVNDQTDAVESNAVSEFTQLVGNSVSVFAGKSKDLDDPIPELVYFIIY